MMQLIKVILKLLKILLKVDIIPIDSVASGGGANTSKTDRLLSKDRAGNTPLHWCCGSLDSEDHLESIKYLIEEAKKREY
eukprot:TRINITY_DN24536_c2_g2_i1.p1 TRINITY_DN24536_c2_g2~~TRINITY_DN24536_c2_g2_i1.p1  ORF type:complete len:80 (-),score=6.75 TRINITY_DN24536_c2_g2_i1:212-451(-)